MLRASVILTCGARKQTQILIVLKILCPKNQILKQVQDDNPGRMVSKHVILNLFQDLISETQHF
ncbi:MAG: hypothetical protein A2887_04615 [Alphaproteobacteria bacterium RIFCSPLOWO2_01_FULL_40_26]|nr:MAG: hypothetical protein A3D15_06120 [Alphaproteobacteria bacterium RIFCSPHIGHO2_02_FULL_40_34]OFW85662.1 MAG: hypothetical protein A2794_00170 [Alphaproteobacteria bacterium RIFCSPHIGHO2_01_FULL_40_8]OFW94148.1 MAG: hypothetical protein A2887_04615 [Alphaproteobacteria bacterium RIFCSPLOWO2_01_FULL_40_26]OFX09297.1 MAG: hypothetical protein A3H30_05440 [Alphaproteobacteria bacterium RIFCSPLOWO2_02_FULL_40_19]OFX10911.1 MAG: hypothetical protein A3G22_01055 [Alphaproteobacteria bacterium RI